MAAYSYRVIGNTMQTRDNNIEKLSKVNRNFERTKKLF